MHRRSFLKALSTPVLLSAGLGSAGMTGWFRQAQAATGKTLLVIFQRGGCDGLNACVPYGDADYYRLRPTIAVAPPDVADPHASLPVDGYFGLHPALKGFADIHARGDLAILPTVHFKGATRSHFDDQAFIESGSVNHLENGWLNRYLATTRDAGKLRAVAMGRELPQSLRGNRYVPSFQNLRNLSLRMNQAESDELLAVMSRVYSQSESLISPYASGISASGLDMIDKVQLFQTLDPSGYKPANGALYPDTVFGQQLSQLAYLIKSGVGLEIATLDIEGWDTHTDQGGGKPGGRQYQAFRNLGDGIGALYRDLGARMNNVVVVTGTEFGRTAAENASGGTDHGGASTWFVVSKQVRGGIHGDWPGLAPAQLVGNRQLRFTVDYRDVYAEILRVHFGNERLTSIFPGHRAARVGFMA